ncbi:MAG TPA: bifunctional 3-deoxy-7-phosphoheptulonate synthase/chorismate mutase type II [Saprospiraceae bacterium]|nr:bifunctional 3-deoxy-7-phosphoheptulonate synthase/chorismate mutase type II [Saprospiraceae bacterium]
MDIKPAIPKAPGQKALILGPCSAESPEQLETLAVQLPPIKPDLFRAGIWKPRTRPGHFQGMGEAAIPWLVDLRQQHGLRICTEVATSHHVELALKAGFDALWIGARTTVNPFYVQEISDALKGVDIPVLVKNPLNPDMFLWLGAIERIMHAGIYRIAAIHRGFSFYGNSIYRNVPRWQIPIELRRRMPALQMIADISHISGNPDHLLEIAQISYDLNYDGLMIEVHPDPLHALSDADQQVTPEFLKHQILNRLVTRELNSSNEIYNKSIQDMRRHIDAIDEEIMDLLSKRMQLAERIGARKRENRIAIFQPDRWDQIVERLMEIGKREGLSDEFITSFIEAIHIESIQHQSRKMNKQDVPDSVK